jgi:hypothetical protein
MNFWIDSHVHIYPQYNVDELLDSALSNFIKFSGAFESDENSYVLFLTQGVNEDAAAVLSAHNKQADRRWAIVIDEPNGCLIAKPRNPEVIQDELNSPSSSATQIVIVFGQQLVSSEGLELLLIGGEARSYEPAQPIGDYLSSIKNEVAILPWGFGKWLGQRGELISSLITDSNYRNKFCIGDIPARYNWFGGKTQFSQAAVGDLPFIRGVDPLPLSHEEKRVASFVSCLHVAESVVANKSLVEAICESVAALRSREPGVECSQFGEYLNLFASLNKQVRLRV